jgi:hypothetical protein
MAPGTPCKSGDKKGLIQARKYRQMDVKEGEIR